MSLKSEGNLLIESHTETLGKLDASKKTRAAVSTAFFSAFNDLRSKRSDISELLLRDKWLSALRANPHLFPDGWYIPPPHGMGVLIGDSSKESRMNYKSLRSESIWPKDTVILSEQNDSMYVYASPVDKRTGMIGDWGMTLYFGNDSQVKAHMQHCLAINQAIVDSIEIGMPFAEIADFAGKLFYKEGLSNDVTSTTDPAGVNIGHTVPASYEQWDKAEIETFKTSDWSKVVEQISKKRKFVSMQEKEQTILPGMALTIEPRLTVHGNPKIPMSSYHTIVLIYPDGRKELLTNFREIFQVAGMDYMLQ